MLGLKDASATIESRFWSKVRKTRGCWEWTGAKAGAGYGYLMLRKGTLGYAHRISYELHKGPIPEGHSVLHTCDRMLCVKPDHLFTGSQRDNIQDMIRKGRQARGLRAIGRRILTDVQVREVRSLRGIESQRSIGKRLGVDGSTINNIWSGRTWRHLR